MTQIIHPRVDTQPRPILEEGLREVETPTLLNNPAESDTEPPVVVEILAPQHGSKLVGDIDSIRLRAKASDGSTNFGSQIRWHSNIDGFLGQRRAIRGPQLTPGKHNLSASVQLPASGTLRSATTSTTSEVTATVTVCIAPGGYPDCDI